MLFGTCVPPSPGRLRRGEVVLIGGGTTIAESFDLNKINPPKERKVSPEMESMGIMGDFGGVSRGFGSVLIISSSIFWPIVGVEMRGSVILSDVEVDDLDVVMPREFSWFI